MCQVTLGLPIGQWKLSMKGQEKSFLDESFAVWQAYIHGGFLRGNFASKWSFCINITKEIAIDNCYVSV